MNLEQYIYQRTLEQFPDAMDKNIQPVVHMVWWSLFCLNWQVIGTAYFLECQGGGAVMTWLRDGRCAFCFRGPAACTCNHNGMQVVISAKYGDKIRIPTSELRQVSSHPVNCRCILCR